MVGLGWFRLGRGGEDGAGLVEVAAFVGGDYVEAGGEGEAEAFEEGIGEKDCGEVEVGIGAEEILGLGVEDEEGGAGIGERGSGARFDRFWRFRLDFGGRLERADEPSAEESGDCRTAAQFARSASGIGRGLHGADVDAICSGEMIEAFGDAPRGGMRAPCALSLGEICDECLSVGLHGGESIIEEF